MEKMNWSRITNDVNGNPRYVIPFFDLLTVKEKRSGSPTNYQIALDRAYDIGGRKYHNKNFGGGIVFSSYSLDYEEKNIRAAVEMATTRELGLKTIDGQTIYHDQITKDQIEYLINLMPHGSGIDCKWGHEENQGNLILTNSFHVMSAIGYYIGWIDFKVTFYHNQPLTNFTLSFQTNSTGLSRRKQRDIRTYLDEIIYEAVREMFF